jgi:hypothetical protein
LAFFRFTLSAAFSLPFLEAGVSDEPGLPSSVECRSDGADDDCRRRLVDPNESFLDRECAGEMGYEDEVGVG